MIVTRPTIRVLNLDEVCVGDCITFILNGKQYFNLTAQKVLKDKVIFMFDDVLTESTRNNACDVLYSVDDISNYVELTEECEIDSVRMPTFGEIFGHYNKFYSAFQPDNDRQFSMMTDARNRLSFYENQPSRYWLDNQCVGTDCYAYVHSCGGVDYGSKNLICGIRPVVTIKLKKEST